MSTAVILSLVGGVIIGGLIWLIVGSRMKFVEDDVQNQILNFGVYFAIAGCLTFPFVFLVLTQTQ